MRWVTLVGFLSPRWRSRWITMRLMRLASGLKGAVELEVCRLSVGKAWQWFWKPSGSERSAVNQDGRSSVRFWESWLPYWLVPYLRIIQ